MITLPFRISILSNQDQSGFRSGVESLDRYFQDQAGQDMRRKMTACYVLEEIATGLIAGYYTLSAVDIPINEAPSDLAKRLPRYPSLPVVRLGRLAVDERFRGQKLGSALLVNAASRAATSDVGMFAMIVDAKNDDAVAFYRYHGFVAYGSSPMTLIAPLKDLLPD